MSDKTNEQTIATSEGAPVTPPTVFDPGAFDRFLDRVAPTIANGGAGAAMRRHEASAIIDHRLCEPGMFDAPFKVTVASLSSDDELAALKNATSQTTIGHIMAKASIRKMNERPLKSFEVDMLWEALGFAGRVAIANLFMKHCTGADEALLGKSLNGVEIG